MQLANLAEITTRRLVVNKVIYFITSTSDSLADGIAGCDPLRVDFDQIVSMYIHLFIAHHDNSSSVTLHTIVGNSNIFYQLNYLVNNKVFYFSPDKTYIYYMYIVH